MTGCVEPIDFGLLNDAGLKGSRTKAKMTGYDVRFADWLIVHRGAGSRDARDKAYCLGKLLREYNTQLASVQEAERVAALIMRAEFEASTKRHKLFALEHYMAFQGISVHFKKPKADKRCLQFLTQEKLSTLIHAVRDYREYALIATFIFTGARLSEVSNLNIENVDFNTNSISVKNTKNSKDRIIPLSPALGAILREYLYRRESQGLTGDSPLFLSRLSKRLSGRQIEKIVKSVAQRAGLEDIHVHMLRHSFASAWVVNGGDIFHLQRVLGHSNISTTMIYLHTDNQTLRRVYEGAMPRV